MSNVNSLAYASTNVTTGAYVTLVASTPIATYALQLQDSSGQLIKIAVGAAGFEVDIGTMPVSGSLVLPVGQIPAGSRISLKSLSATANSGFASVSLQS